MYKIIILILISLLPIKSYSIDDTTRYHFPEDFVSISKQLVIESQVKFYYTESHYYIEVDFKGEEKSIEVIIFLKSGDKVFHEIYKAQNGFIKFSKVEGTYNVIFIIVVDGYIMVRETE